MIERDYEEIQRNVDYISHAVPRDLEQEIRGYLDKCGLFYKSFLRVKKGASLREKLKNKIEEKGEDYRLQDLIGVRIVVYFKEDITLCEKIIKGHFDVIDISKNEENAHDFGPQRINYVCRLPDSVIWSIDKKIWEYPIDKSFEIQIRTIFSEGWHEIEHDFRYKCQEEWEDTLDLSRTLNGVLATLENCDWAIASLFSQAAYRHYKAKEWIPMLKNTFKLRIAGYGEMKDILKIFDEDYDVAKQFFRIDREGFLLSLSDIQIPIKLQMDNLVYLANLFQIHNDKIMERTPDRLKDCVER